MVKNKTNIVKEIISDAKIRERRVRIKVGKKEVTIKVDKEKGFLYYVKGSPLSIYKVRMQHMGRTKTTLPKTLVRRTMVARNSKYIYYVDRQGYLARAKRKGA